MDKDERARLLALVEEMRSFNVHYHDRDETRAQLLTWASRLSALLPPVGPEEKG